MVPRKKKWTKKEVAVWTQERLTIEADELPVKRILDVISHNDVMRAKGYDETHEDWWHVTLLQRVFSQYFDYRRHALIRSKDFVSWRERPLPFMARPKGAPSPTN